MRDKLSLILPSAIIILAEAMFFSGMTEACLELHLLNIFLCIILSIFLAKQSDLFIAFSLISLLRVLNIGMPKFFTASLWFFPFIYIPVIFAAFVVWWVDNGEEGRRPGPKAFWIFLNGARTGEKATFRWVHVVWAIGIGLILSMVEFAILKNEALIPDLSVINLISLLVVMVVFVGFGEELVFRGILQNRVRERWGTVFAIIFAAAMFGIMHSGYSSLVYMAYVFVVGLILGYSYHRTKSLVFVALIHGFLNFFLFSVMPLTS